MSLWDYRWISTLRAELALGGILSYFCTRRMPCYSAGMTGLHVI